MFYRREKEREIEIEKKRVCMSDVATYRSRDYCCQRAATVGVRKYCCQLCWCARWPHLSAQTNGGTTPTCGPNNKRTRNETLHVKITRVPCHVMSLTTHLTCRGCLYNHILIRIRIRVLVLFLHDGCVFNT